MSELIATYRIRPKTGIADNTDPKLEFYSAGKLCFLALTDPFIEKNKLLEVVTLTPPINNDYVIYRVETNIDANGNTIKTNIDLKHIATVVTVNRVTNNLCYDPVLKSIVNIMVIDDIDIEYWKNRTISTIGYVYNVADVNSQAADSIRFGIHARGDELTEPNQIIDSKVITVTVQGIKVGGNKRRIKFNTNTINNDVDIYEEINTLPLLEVDLDTINWTPGTISLFTIYMDSPLHNRVRSLGKVNSPKIYIPLV